ncbi:MAG: UDP-N-acetylmuramate--L-alanine ligase [Micrococcales bacterium]|nr:UDP-N-acetylmuramate--L-alanine ligase [Micrococcales bacterium]
MSDQPQTVNDLGRVHIVGIGGSGMSGLAQLLLDRGVAVSGSDIRDSDRIEALRSQGASIHIGHDAGRLVTTAGPVQTVVDTPDIPDDNPEILAARQQRIPVISRSQALAIVMSDHEVIGIAGTHGKTTTSSMLTIALQRCGLDPSYAIGSEVYDLGGNAHIGTGDLFVVEADESDGAFLLMDPRAVVVTNVEADHLNHWGEYDNLLAAFDDYVDLVAANQGFAVIYGDETDSANLAERAKGRQLDVVTYGQNSGVDYRLEVSDHQAGYYSFDVIHAKHRLGTVTLSVPGYHNALNATAALTVCHRLNLPLDEAILGLRSFTGTRRRLELKGEVTGIRVFDDYAHHPTEVVATLSAAREFAGAGRVVVAFQPYRYYRTELFAEEFGQALGLADDVVVMEVFDPGDKPVSGASGQVVANHVRSESTGVIFESSWDAVAGHIADRTRSGDIVLTVGAEEMAMLGPEVLAELQRREAEGAIP